MNDEQLIISLASMSEKEIEDFCKAVLDKSINLDISYDNYIALTLVLLNYFNKSK